MFTCQFAGKRSFRELYFELHQEPHRCLRGILD